MSGPSNDLLIRSHVSTFKRGVNVSAFKRLTPSESRQYLQTWRECQGLQTTCLLDVTSVPSNVACTSVPSNDLRTRSHVSTFKRGVNVRAFNRLTYSEACQCLPTIYIFSEAHQRRWREWQGPQTICFLGFTSVLKGVA